MHPISDAGFRLSTPRRGPALALIITPHRGGWRRVGARDPGLSDNRGTTCRRVRSAPPSASFDAPRGAPHPRTRGDQENEALQDVRRPARFVRAARTPVRCPPKNGSSGASLGFVWRARRLRSGGRFERLRIVKERSTAVRRPSGIPSGRTGPLTWFSDGPGRNAESGSPGAGHFHFDEPREPLPSMIPMVPGRQGRVRACPAGLLGIQKGLLASMSRSGRPAPARSRLPVAPPGRAGVGREQSLGCRGAGKSKRWFNSRSTRRAEGPPGEGVRCWGNRRCRA